MCPEAEDAAQRDLRSFGRRRGRKPSLRQQRLLVEALPRFSIDLTQPPPFPPDQPLWLEIGFGGSEHLIWQAEHNPAVHFIGCEPFQDGIVKALTAIEEKRLGNIDLHDGDARDVLRWLPAGSLRRVFVLFPDPWPKKRHAKRRLLSPETVALIADRMAAGAELRFATDIGDYARSALIALSGEPRLQWTATGPSDWRVRPDDWPGTRYEAKALREGRRCYYVRFRRVQ